MQLTSADAILDAAQGVEAFYETARQADGRLRLFSLETGVKPPLHGLLINRVIDPYSGPDRA